MKKYMILLLVSAISMAAQAIVVQKVYLKNGSVLSGYIQKQDDNGLLTVATQEALICLKGTDANISNEQNYQESTLSKEWINWAEKHDALQGNKGNRTLQLADVHAKNGKTSYKVYIMESGITTKFLEITPNTYQVKWKDVISIKGDKRPKTALSGIDRIYQLKNGSQYEGQYAEETDSTLSLYMPNGSVRSFKLNDVVKYTFKPVCATQDIFEQSPLIDIVKSNNGSEVRGIIIEQNYSSNKNSENYVLVRQESGAIQSIKVSDISETRKEENQKYNPQIDILLKPGQVMINREEATFVKTTEENDEIILDSINNKIQIAMGANNSTRISVEYRVEDNGSTDIYQLIKAEKATIKKANIYRFTYKDLVNSVYRAVKTETSVNHTTKAKYVVGGNGVFVLYDTKHKKAITFIVK